MNTYGTAAKMVLCGFVLASCTETVTVSSGMFGDDVKVERRNTSRQFTDDGPNQSTVRPGALSRGSDRFVNIDRQGARAPSRALVSPNDNETVDVSLVNASIAAAAEAVLGDALGKKYVVSDDIDGRVTVQSTGPIPKAALLELFEAALSASGARLETSGNVVKVVSGTAGARGFRLAREGVGSGANILVAPIEFISAEEMVRLMQPLVSEGLTAIPDKRRNLVFLNGSSDQLEAALDALNLFDVDVLRGKSVAIVELNSGEPAEIAEQLGVLFENEARGSLDGVIEFIPNDRMGSILVITSRSRYLARAQKWIRELDRAASGARRYIDTYELENRSAEDIAPVLDDVLSDLQSQAPATSSEDGAQISATVGSRSRVAADEGRNTLLVRATRQEHREIRSLIAELDSSPQQVMLEATIAEVTLNDQVDLGVRWFFESGNFDFTFSDASSGSTGGNFPGFSALFGSNSSAVALNALSGVTDVKIISSPTLMVLDNEEAVLQIGDQVPVATQSSQSSTDANAPTITKIEYRDTGVILRVEPSISRSGQVILNVSQEVSSVSETQTSGIDSPTIRQRKIATNVLLRDGMTLALGGLIQENDTKTVTRVPGLGEAPVVGALFRRTQSSKRRSELLILIRPRVVDNAANAKALTTDWRSRLAGANSILGSGLGSSRHTVRDVLP